jgi:hypothetical protein
MCMGGTRRTGEAMQERVETQAGGAVCVGEAGVGEAVGAAWVAGVAGAAVPVLHALEHWQRLSAHRA